MRASSQSVALAEQPAAPLRTVDVYTPAPPSAGHVEAPKKLDVDAPIANIEGELVR